jgi:hypothetical protein
MRNSEIANLVYEFISDLDLTNWDVKIYKKILPDLELTETVDSAIITVSPMQKKLETVSRSSKEISHTIQVAVHKKIDLDAGDFVEFDYLESLVDELISKLSFASFGDAKFTGIDFEELYNLELMESAHQFISIITLTYMTMETTNAVA